MCEMCSSRGVPVPAFLLFISLFEDEGGSRSARSLVLKQSFIFMQLRAETHPQFLLLTFIILSVVVFFFYSHAAVYVRSIRRRH